MDPSNLPKTFRLGKLAKIGQIWLHCFHVIHYGQNFSPNGDRTRLNFQFQDVFEIESGNN